MSGLRRGDRPGHDQHPLHPVRPRRATRRQRPARARADHAAAGLGRARPAGDLAADLRGDRGGAGARGRRRRGRCRRWASPTSARRPSCGTARAESRSTTRSCGRTPAPSRSCGGSPATRGRIDCAARVGLPLASYFSGPKLTWLLEHVPGARERAERGELAFGTIDSWLVWNLTGGARGGSAPDRRDQREPDAADGPARPSPGTSRACELMGVPRGLLPEIRSSSEHLRRGPRGRRSRGGRWRASSATSRRRCSGSAASAAGRRRTPTARDPSCC